MEGVEAHQLLAVALEPDAFLLGQYGQIVASFHPFDFRLVDQPSGPPPQTLSSSFRRKTSTVELLSQ